MDQTRKKLVACAKPLPPPELPDAEPDREAMKPQITQLLNTPALKRPDTGGASTTKGPGSKCTSDTC
jgi:hypothetical protein